MRVGVDTGGTFTDVVTETGGVVKVPSTPDDPAGAVAAGIGGVAVSLLAHGTTVATNALLERKGAVVALVTNAGMEDVLEIARQHRPSLYDQWADRPAPLVPRELRFGVAGRLAADGSELEPVDLGSLPSLPGDVGAVAVCLLHSDLDDGHERAVAGALRAAGHDVTASHEVSPEFREYERTVTTVVNAYLRPVCRAYVHRVGALAPGVRVLTSAGGLVPADDGAERPAALLLSGPAAGVRAAAAAAAANGFSGAVSFDMGGTSTDVCLILGGLPEPAPTLVVGGFPVRLASLDVHTIGAGGGSIAAIDPGGAVQVGPRSAGAVPGPACYGRGGREPTVTDADLVLGRIPGDHPFPGIGRLDRDAASAALQRAGLSAADVVAVVDANMAQALRRVSVERGVDPSGLALVAFGGAGPLHACALADALGMAAVVVPPRAGVFSAVGLLAAPDQRDLVRSWPTPLDHKGLDEARAALAADASAALAHGIRAESAGASSQFSDGVGLLHGIHAESAADPPGRGIRADSAGHAGDAGGRSAAERSGPDGGVVVTTWLDCRYQGQSHELTVPSIDAFHAEHARRNGYARPHDPVEVVAIRARAALPSPVGVTDLAPPARRPVVGPAVLGEPDCTIWVPDGWAGQPGPDGSLVLRRQR